MEELIQKYLNDSLTPEEYDRLLEAVKDPEYRALFEDRFREHFRILQALAYSDPDEGYKKVWAHIDQQQLSRPGPEKKMGRSNRAIRTVRYKWYAMAAAIAVIIVLAVRHFYQSEERMPDTLVTSELVPSQDDIILELGDGSHKVIQPGEKAKIVDGQGRIVGHQELNLLDYSGETEAEYMEEMVYNTLIVPYGQRFEIVLSDKTRVHLQAGTSLRFPVRFDGEDKRIVTVSGEAYFEVTQDMAHPFVVEAEGLRVLVTGTQFNVAAYPEDVVTDVVLVEGGVELYTDSGLADEVVKITPGEKGSLNRESHRIDTESVNTQLYTSWIDGDLVFRQMPFDQILHKLERYYNVEIINKDKKLGQTAFNAHFKNETIADVLSFFNDIYEIQYVIRDNKVFIE